VAYEAIRTPSFRLLPFDDEDKNEVAERTALTIQQNPRVLAVIGHGITSTTQASGAYYVQAGIPFIVPLPTGELSSETEPARRFPNTFRLPPSDKRAQAPAIAVVVLQLLEGARNSQAGNPVSAHIVADINGNVKAYSNPLAHAIQDILKARGEQAALTESMDLASTAADIYGEPTPAGAVVVFCGYGNAAKLFLTSLRERYGKAPGPTIVVPDGTPEIADSLTTLRFTE
jgi:ABC-type branched-subunit amino acid transport system substrate-binding protein